MIPSMPDMPDKHHRKSIRIPGYDYSQEGHYFVTICMNHRELLFGDIVDGEMVLNEFGKIIAETWQWLAKQYVYINLDESVIMPNHLHGIVEFMNDCSRGGSRTSPTDTKRKPLGRIIGAFKTVSTKRINQIQNTLGLKLWQRNYWEHVIRDDYDLYRIRQYIVDNPFKWKDDKYYL